MADIDPTSKLAPTRFKTIRPGVDPRHRQALRDIVQLLARQAAREWLTSSIEDVGKRHNGAAEPAENERDNA